MGRFYVYVLVDPRDSTVFYVGKGCNWRCRQHQAMAKSPSGHPNIALDDRIKAIASSGNSVGILVPWNHLSEAEAFRRESLLIGRIGIDRLCNGEPGRDSNWTERQMQAAKRCLEVIRPFAHIYSDLVSHIEEMAQGRKLVPPFAFGNGDLPMLRSYWDGTWQSNITNIQHG